MRAVRILLVLFVLPVMVRSKDVATLEGWVDQLPAVDASDHGYTAHSSGTAFLPRTDASKWHMGIIGAAPPKVSEPLRQLVAAGAEAIPVLVRHLDDKRPLKLEPVSGMMWMDWPDEYDYNRRLRKEPPEGVNRRDSNGETNPREHQICVGDLCFVALGQIVNRRFSATRYQPTAGLVVSSPVYSQRLLKVARQDYQSMTHAQHRAELIQDFQQPDHADRLNGAAMRLAYYYPEVLDAMALRQLAVPVYDSTVAYHFARKVLYPLKDAGKRRDKLEAHLRQQGEPARDGLLNQLFFDLEMQIADEEGRTAPGPKDEYDARNVLVQLFQFTPPVTMAQRPFIDTWTQGERARFVEALGPAVSDKIKEEVLRMLRAGKQDHSLALACMKVLAGSGHDAELIAQCRLRETLSKYEREDFRAMREALEAASSPHRNR